MCMFGPKRSRQARSQFAVFHYRDEQEGVHFEVRGRKAAWEVLHGNVQSAIFPSRLHDF